MESVDRFYRSYLKYLNQYDGDTLFILLNSLHSLNHKLMSEHKIDLFKTNEFITLQTIRNHLHHESEITNKLTTIPVSNKLNIETDLIFLCLMNKHDLETSIDNIKNKHKEKHREIINKTVHCYGSIINIGHVIFNMAAKLIIILNKNKIKGKSEEYFKNYNAVMSDISNNYSITISGKIFTQANNVSEIEGALRNIIKSNN